MFWTARYSSQRSESAARDCTHARHGALCTDCALTRRAPNPWQLVGTPVKRSSIIEAFQNAELKKGEPRVLLLNLRDESAAGANLTAASHAIFVHPLLVNSQVEYDSCDTQAIGRVRRYGQNRTVQIYRYMVDDSIDTDIFLNRRSDGAALVEAGATGGDVRPIEDSFCVDA